MPNCTTYHNDPARTGWFQGTKPSVSNASTWRKHLDVTLGAAVRGAPIVTSSKSSPFGNDMTYSQKPRATRSIEGLHHLTGSSTLAPALPARAVRVNRKQSLTSGIAMTGKGSLVLMRAVPRRSRSCYWHSLVVGASLLEKHGRSPGSDSSAA